MLLQENKQRWGGLIQQLFYSSDTTATTILSTRTNLNVLMNGMLFILTVSSYIEGF